MSGGGVAEVLAHLFIGGQCINSLPGGLKPTSFAHFSFPFAERQVFITAG